MSCFERNHTDVQNTNIQYLSDGKIELVINIPDGFRTETVSDGYLIRRTAVDFGVGLITNIKCGVMLVKALQWRSTNADTPPMHIQEYYRSNSFATFSANT